MKSQAIVLLRKEKEALKERLSLLKMKTRLEKQMGKNFDPVVSGKLDALQILLEE